jgi:hypothetical protein
MTSSPRPLQGQIILIAMVFFAIFLTIAAALMSYVIQFRVSERHAVASAKALYLAEAGFDKAIYELNRNSGYAGETDTALGEGEFTVSVATIDSSTKRITATGYVPNSAAPIATRTISATAAINSSIVSFRFGVQVGEGGVTMDNGARINGNLYTNGSVTGTGADTGAPFITGDVTVAGGTAATPDQEWTVENGSINLGDASTRAAVAQSFRPSATEAINKVSLYLKKVGTPGDIAIKIVTDNGGKPSNTVRASGTLPASSVSGNYAFVDGNLSTAPTLTGGTTYWIIAVAPVNASSYFVWGRDTADAYAAGTGKTSANWSANNATWAATNSDLDFKAWMGGVITSLSGVHVGGTVWAHSITDCEVDGNALYQTISDCTVAGNETITTTDASPAGMPISDAQIDAWEEAAAAGGLISGDYAINGTESLGPIAIDGDLAVNGTLYLTGPLWVKGDVTFGVNSSLIVHSSTGNNGAVIIADRPGSESTNGTVTLANNMTIAGNGSAGSYPMILSTKSGSQAIDMNNNSTSVILYAPNGTVTVSNNAVANQITAYQLHLNNNTTVNYVNGLQNQGFSNGPGGSWAFVPGTYVITR